VDHRDVADRELPRTESAATSSPRDRKSRKSLLGSLIHRIRLALTMGSFNKLSGQIEADETFIGGKSRNMPASKRAVKITGTGGKTKPR